MTVRGWPIGGWWRPNWPTKRKERLSGMLCAMEGRGSSREGPKLSFVVPAYRVEKYLPTCINSLLAYAAADIEVVAVDDDSPDDCGKLLEDYAERDVRVRVLHLPANVGLGQARNAGLELATGEYVWFVDGDDWLPPSTVSTVIQRLTEHSPDVLLVDHAEVFDDGRIMASRPAGLLRGVAGPLRLADHPQLLRSAQSACTKIVRRTFLDEIKLRFAPGWYEDSSFSHPLLIAAERIDVLNRVCYHYRQRSHGITRTVDSRHFEVFEQYQRLFDRIDENYPHAERFRAELFRLMIDHYLVITGHDARLPQSLRREFFARVNAEYHARIPDGGYEQPRGPLGLKHSLVRRNAYRTYAALRSAYRPVRVLRRAVRLRHSWRAGTSVPGR